MEKGSAIVLSLFRLVLLHNGMKIKTLQPLLINSHNWPKWSVLDVDDCKGKRLINEGVAEVYTGPKPSEPTEVIHTFEAVPEYQATEPKVARKRKVN